VSGLNGAIKLNGGAKRPDSGDGQGRGRGRQPVDDATRRRDFAIAPAMSPPPNTPSVSRRTKYTPYITANGARLDPDSVNVTNCVGQNVNFQINGLPSVSDAVAYGRCRGKLSTDSLSYVRGIMTKMPSLLLKSHPFSEWRFSRHLVGFEGRSRRFRHRLQMNLYFSKRASGFCSDKRKS